MHVSEYDGVRFVNTASTYAPRKDTIPVWRKYTRLRMAELRRLFGSPSTALEGITLRRVAALEWELVRLALAEERGEVLTAEQQKRRQNLQAQLRDAMAALAPIVSEAA
jgi:hypothetical protein